MRAERTHGFTLAEMLCAVAVVALLAALAVPALASALERARTAALAEDARLLFLAFMAHHAEHDRYPPSHGKPSERLDRRTLRPLTGSALLREGQSLTRQLHEQRLASYRAFDGGRPGTGFHAELVHGRDQRIRVLVADTDRYPGARGVRLHGVYLIRGNELLAPPTWP